MVINLMISSRNGLLIRKKKRPGRPSTGKAKTSAQRQADYRRRQELNLGHDFSKVNLNVWITYDTKLALARLANRSGVSAVEILQQLIKQADQAVFDSLVDDRVI